MKLYVSLPHLKVKNLVSSAIADLGIKPGMDLLYVCSHSLHPSFHYSRQQT